jgi:hypothetical protein
MAIQRKRRLGLLLLEVVAAHPLESVEGERVEKGAWGRPSELQTKWVEVTTRGVAGRYVHNSQGAMINDFHAIRKDGRIFQFVDDPDAFAADRVHLGGGPMNAAASHRPRIRRTDPPTSP